MISTDGSILRAISREVVEKMLPELRYPGATERVALAELALDYLAADLDVLPRVLNTAISDYRGTLDQVLKGLPDGVAMLSRQAYAALPMSLGAREPELIALRKIGAELIRALVTAATERSRAEDRTVLARGCADIAAADVRFLEAFQKEVRERGAPTAMATSAAAPGAAVASERVTPESFTRYLRSRSLGSSVVKVTKIEAIPGGRSKRTLLVNVKNGDTLPERLVIRQDLGLVHANSRIHDEYQPLMRCHALGLPVPQIFHFEPDVTELGPPFLLLAHMNGRSPGDFFGLKEHCPKAYRELARTFAVLHSTDPARLELKAPDKTQDPLLNHIQREWAIWQRNTIKPSPLIDFAYSWAAKECIETVGTWSPVHGDCGPHNLLVHDDHLLALLDWEYVHCGDPAEDLGTCRLYVEEMMPWSEFTNEYRAAGGPDVSERRIRASMLGNYLKGAALVATSARNFAEGATNDYVKGVHSYTSLRKIEMKIFGLLRDQFK